MAAKWEDSDTIKHEITVTRNEIRQLYAKHLGTPSYEWHEIDRRMLEILLHKLNGYSSILDREVEARR